MTVKLLNTPTLEFTDSSIGQCYDKGPYTDPTKMCNRIDRVANVSKHSSVLEFTDAIFEVTASTKVLLEMTRHRQASYACKSSRYTLNKSELVFEQSNNELVNEALATIKEQVLALVIAGVPNDELSLLLPQAYQYRWNVKFNYRSLQNFLQLRTHRGAHYQIREVALAMYNQLPKDHKFLFKEFIHNDSNKT